MLTLFHTAPANQDLFGNLLKEIAPDIATHHVVRADLLDRAREAGGINAALGEEIEAAILASIEPGTKVLLCTCSTIGGCADRMGHPWVPILRVDRAMARVAVRAGNRVLIAACLESTVEPTLDLVRHAGYEVEKDQSDGFHIGILRIPEAWPLFANGDKAGYYALIAERLRGEIASYDAIVLAQASMAGAAALLSDSSIPILSSPRLGVADAVATYRYEVARQPDRLDTLCTLLEQADDANERLVLKMAVQLIQQARHPNAWFAKRAVLTFEEYCQAPGRWELMDGQLHSDGWPPQVGQTEA